jgi:hypothetical protein
VPLFQLSSQFLNPKHPLTLKLISAKGLGNFAMKIEKFNLLNKEEQNELCESQGGLIENLLVIL